MMDRDQTSAGDYHQLVIIEKFEGFINYMYPIAQNVPRAHGIARDAFLTAMFSQIDLFIVAGKSGQASRLYSADAGMAGLRFWLRFMAHPGRRLISLHQHRVAATLLAEVGKMLGAWIKGMRGRG
ncbi:MAG: diversity-generating retroelement protein Avd [Rhodospirillaceae bacterium]